MKTYIFKPVVRAVLASLAGLCLLLITSCSANKKEATQVKEKFPITQPLVLDTVYTKEYVAEIQSIQNVEIRAKIPGFIEKIHVDEGKSVQAGQLLFTISNHTYRQNLHKTNAQLKSAIAEAKFAAVELKNTKELVRKNIVSKTELEKAEAKLEAIQAKMEEARSAVATAKLNLEFTQVRAPFSGGINRIPNKSGSLVEEGSLLTTISNNLEVFAYFHVSEKEYLDFIESKEINKNKEVTLVLANNNVFPQPGKIETVEGEIDRSTGNLAFRARFANPQQLLKHGSSGKIRLEIKLANALIIPQKATFDIQDKTFVYVVDHNNIVRLRTIVPKLRLPHLYVVASGLSPQDKILYEGLQRVKEGEKINTEFVPQTTMPQLLAQQ
ncbi:efflux RND transporter periplasmic adaptor subunit [Adhaeribacter aquaticus]|uniref:efflux RND transporter periplasmic adaptor subunit n=1 Tax=Adhaeribacter aquaticus TaxID=299567 RepID=UPI00041A03F9|nr:efflux RND transporter periplasmic adaptor subunit [Adhaeribacter aquaticus]